MSERAYVLFPMASLDHVAPAILGLVGHLPSEGTPWTQAERDRFLAVFVVVLDYCHPAIVP